MRDAKEFAGLPPRAAGDAPLRHPGSARHLVLAALFYGALLAIAVAWRLWADGILPWRATRSLPGWSLPLCLALGLAYGGALVAASRAWTARSEAGRRLSERLAAAIGPISARSAVLLAAASGIAEEAFFRGALQPQVGWPLATVAFGLAHFHPSKDLRAWSVSAFAAGLGFAALFELTGDLTAPATAHFLLNAVNLRWLAKRSAAGSAADPNG
jgi:hypothetical protein